LSWNLKRLTLEFSKKSWKKYGEKNVNIEELNLMLESKEKEVELLNEKR